MDTLVEALDLIDRGYLQQACRCIEVDEGCEAASTNYAALTKTLYRDRRDVADMLFVAKAAVRYQLGQSELARHGEPALATRLKTAAKSLAYNVAANCWPGWGEEGVAIDAGAVEEGLELARLSLQLVEELKLGALPLGSAFWLVGALNLAAGRPDAAKEAFLKSREWFASGGLVLQTLLLQGYQAMALGSGPHGDEIAATRLQDAIDALVLDGSKEGRFFAAQLVTAAQVLTSQIAPSELAVAPSTDM